MSFFLGCRGRIYHHRWLPDGNVRSAVVLLHGYGEHLGLYDALARRLVADGHAVYAMDAVGHGRSDGKRALIESWDHYVDDARQLAGLARNEHPEAPLVVIGHSAGAVAAMLLALRFPSVPQALVLSGAPLLRQEWIDAELARGEAETDVGDPTELMSTHPEYVHALLHDPLTWKGGFRRETLLALTATWPQIGAGLAEGQPDVPILVIHGEADPIVPVEDARHLVGHLPRATLRTFPGDLHDVLNEHDRDKVHDVVATYVTSIATTSSTVASMSLGSRGA
jgi:alpha-beta hydrolase superfamily lysophospholipase